MKKLTSIWACFALLTIGVFLKISDPYIVERVRLINFDLYQKTIQPSKDESIALLEIGEDSLHKFGQWPWPRAHFAQMISDLRNANAGIIAFTVMFPEADRFQQDEIFQSWIKDNGIILSQTGSSNGRSDTAPFVGTVVLGDGDPYDFVNEYPGIVTNIPELESVAWGIGHINSNPESDNVTRRIPLLIQVNDRLYPSLTMEILRANADKKSYTVKAEPTGIENFRIPPFEPFITDSTGSMWLSYSKQYDSYQYGIDTIPDLKGKTILVGVTAEGVVPLVSTPQGAKYPHQIQASSLSDLMNPGEIISRPNYIPLLEIALTVFLGLGIILSVYYLPLVWSLISFFAIAGVSFGLPYYLWIENHFLVEFIYTLSLCIVLFAHSSFNNFWVQFKLRQEIQKQFAGYCSPTVVRMLQENPSLIKDGMKREISICFSDLRGFTPLGESFGDDVKGLTKLMNDYMDAITQPVLNADGMIIKYIGDASMHVHNAPNDDPDHPKSAVQTGLNMLKAVEKFNEKITAEGRPPIGMGAGINSGLGYLGEMGSTSRHSYDVLGDAVSTAARIESKCKEYGCLLLVGESTVKHCEDDFFFLKIDDLAVKGKSVGIGIYTVLSDWDYAWNNTDWPSRQDAHNKMHELYRSQQFDLAIKFCNDLKGEFDGKMDKYYDMWIERCEFQKTQDLPEDWNGVFIATTK